MEDVKKYIPVDFIRDKIDICYDTEDFECAFYYAQLIRDYFHFDILQEFYL